MEVHKDHEMCNKNKEQKQVQSHNTCIAQRQALLKIKERKLEDNKRDER